MVYKIFVNIKEIKENIDLKWNPKVQLKDLSKVSPWSITPQSDLSHFMFAAFTLKIHWQSELY